MRENRLRWYGDVYRRLVDVAAKRSNMVTVDGSTKERGRPKLTLEAVVQKDLGFFFSLNMICLCQSSMEKMDLYSQPQIVVT